MFNRAQVRGTPIDQALWSVANTVALGMIYLSAKIRNLRTAFLWQGHHG